MNENDSDKKKGPPDRRLGDEWLDWNGDPRDAEIDEKLSTFLTLAAGAVLIFFACLQIAWYLAKPRFEQLSPLLSSLIGWVTILLTVIVLLLVAVETTLLLKFRKSIFPYMWGAKFLLSLLSKTMWLGGKMGISRDIARFRRRQEMIARRQSHALKPHRRLGVGHDIRRWFHSKSR